MMDPQALQQIMANAQQVQALQQQFSQFAQQFQGNQRFNPYDRVQGMMRSGEMSQSDFERCRQMANMMTGKNY